MKVIHVLPTMEFGGAEKMAVDLAIQQQKSGIIQPELVALWRAGDLEKYTRENEIPFFVVKEAGPLNLITIKRLYNYFKQRKTDIVHTHLLQSQLYAGPAARMAGIPVVHTKHGRTVISLSRYPRFRRWIYNLSARIVAVSEDTAGNFSMLAGIDRSRIEVIVNGIDFNRFSVISKENAREKLAISNRTILFGTVSRLHIVKNHIALINAFSEIADDYDECKLLIVGDGPERLRIEEAINVLNLCHRVILTGFRDDVAQILPAIDLFILPSLEEGLPITLLEAIATGLPVAASRTGGIPEVLDGNVPGTLFDPKDHDSLVRIMRDFLDDRKRFEVMATEAHRKAAEKFTLEKMADSYRILYEKIIQEWIHR